MLARPSATTVAASPQTNLAPPAPETFVAVEGEFIGRTVVLFHRLDRHAVAHPTSGHLARFEQVGQGAGQARIEAPDASAFGQASDVLYLKYCDTSGLTNRKRRDLLIEIPPSPIIKNSDKRCPGRILRGPFPPSAESRRLTSPSTASYITYIN